jgi:hypothetical protein
MRVQKLGLIGLVCAFVLTGLAKFVVHGSCPSKTDLLTELFASPPPLRVPGIDRCEHDS